MSAPTLNPFRLQSASGLGVEVLANGSIRRIDHGDVILNAFLGNELEGGPANIYLRRHGRTPEHVALLGPRSLGRVHVDERSLTVVGAWNDLRFCASLRLADSVPAWFWHVEVENAGGTAVDVDLIYAQDLGLAHYGAVRLNEYYTSQYIDYTPLDHPKHGHVLAVRQNLSMGGRQPWALVGSLNRAVSFATDALQLHGLATRAGLPAAALSEERPAAKRLQHEHSTAVIQDTRMSVAPGESWHGGFFGWYEPDHQAASSTDDLAYLDRAVALPEARFIVPVARGTAREHGVPVTTTMFSERPVLVAADLSDADIEREFGTDLREREREDGRTLSFFTGADRHVVLRAKELSVLRPHGHILRTGNELVPDEASLTSTVWMAGVFHSLVTQGHVNINRLLSTNHGYLSVMRSYGQRIFVELDDGYHLLDVPSAFEMSPNGCRWLYEHTAGALEVRSRASVDRHALYLEIVVLRGGPRRFLISNHVAINGDDGSRPVPVRYTADQDGITIATVPDCDVGWRFPDGTFRIDFSADAVEKVGGDELLFADGGTRDQPFLVIATAPVRSFDLCITGQLVEVEQDARGRRDAASDERAAETFWATFTRSLDLRLPRAAGETAARAARIKEIQPWLAHNAMIHYLAPRGLEQYSGGGWGTRDVSQGPVEMMLALGRFEPVRDLLIRLFKSQNPDGDWPQWFTFFDRDRGIRAPDSHGDIVFWPLLALAEYIRASDDTSLLSEAVPFFHPDGDAKAEHVSVREHVSRAMAVIERRVIPGTILAAYGHGDWDDSLQPADPAMRERLCSAWTVTLQYQTFTALAAASRRAGYPDDAARLDMLAGRIREDFQRLLIADGVLTGFAYFLDDGGIEYWLHPSDPAGGIRYRLLPMIHAIINGMLTPEQARSHIDLIKAHMLAPDGARLFDRPLDYHGGVQRRFQRAETATYVGREIGLMYMHAHLRFAESMAYFGDADAFFGALCKANPVGIRSVVPNSALRQANCYYSSSDAAFADRYEESSRYKDVMSGEVPVEGGWRVYSSGAGIFLRLIHHCFLGLRRGKSSLVIDPAIPKSLDGLVAELEFEGRRLKVTYTVAARGCGPMALTLNGTELPFERIHNPYRTGGAAVSMGMFAERLRGGTNELAIALA